MKTKKIDLLIAKYEKKKQPQKEADDKRSKGYKDGDRN